MFASIPSVELVLQCLLPTFTQPSFQTHVEVFLGWVICLGRRTEYGVFQTIRADMPVSRKQRHPFDRFYNFFSRSAWTVRGLAHELAVAIVLRLNPKGLLYLVVDDTLLHKRGKHVYGLGWFRDAVASTAKRVATASGNHWVVMGLAIRIPGTEKIYCLPIHARLHLPGKGQPSEATLAKEMLRDVFEWFPDRQLVLLGDGAYSAKNLLGDLDERVTHVGVMRSDAAIYDPQVPKQSKSKRGRKPGKGPRPPAQGGYEKGRPQPNGNGPLGLAMGRNHGLRRDPPSPGPLLPSGVAEGVGLAADPGGTRARSGRQVQGYVLVHHRRGRRTLLGHRRLLSEVVHRGRFQSQ